MTQEEIEKLARRYVNSLTPREKFLIGCNHNDIKLPPNIDIGQELGMANTDLKDIPNDDAIRASCAGNEEEMKRIDKLVRQEIHRIFMENPPIIEAKFETVQEELKKIEGQLKIPLK